MLVALLTACTHHQALSNLQAQIQPFKQARSQSVQIVKAAKRDFGAEDVNDLQLKYAALQTSANNYVGLEVEAVTTASFDAQKNDEDAAALRKAIDGFNGSLAPLVSPTVPGQTSSEPARVPLPLSNSWVDSLRAQLAASWPQYQHALTQMSSGQRVAMAEELKQQYAWPEFQDIVP
jgi:hypothetical protein